jgi:hypothetical protein
MDRNIVYPASIPLDTDLLSLNRNAMIGLGYLIQAVLGTTTIVDGLACSPTVPASMTVTVGPGCITQLSTIDQNAYGSLPADTNDPLVKMGINATPTSFTLAAPTTSGQAIDYLIEAAFEESDADPVVLPYYNAANPSQPYSGPGNSGTAQNTQRIQRVQLQLKSGVPANAGSQTAPAADSGWTGLYIITVGYGQTTITTANISVLPSAPYLRAKLPALGPGFGSGVQTFTSSGSFQVPAGVIQVEVEVWGGGAGSFASTSSAASGGGGGGGYARKRLTGLTPGQVISVTVGSGGIGGTVGGSSATGGQSSAFGAFISAAGGTLNPYATVSSPQLGGGGGMGQGGDVNLTGSAGQPGVMGVGGMGGGAPMGGMQNSGTAGNPGTSPGGGASGAGTGSNGSTPYTGANGASGLVVVRW